MVFAVHQHELALGIHMSPPSWTTPPSHPSQLSQSTSFGFPASYSKLTLAIYLTYGNAYVSMLFSQIIPPLPSPTESKRLFYTSVSLLLSRIQASFFTLSLSLRGSLVILCFLPSAYLRLLIFLLAILIPACASSSLWWSLHSSFSMMYSAQKLNKQGDNIQPWHIPFPIWNQSVVPCPVLTVASWPEYRRSVRWSGISISWRIFHSLLWSTQSKALA